MDGKVSGKITYGEWLRRQSASAQDEVLGPTRGRIFRESPGMDIGRFSDRRGRRLTLKELADREGFGST